jgi:hypothetical protein
MAVRIVAVVFRWITMFWKNTLLLSSEKITSVLYTLKMEAASSSGINWRFYAATSIHHHLTHKYNVDLSNAPFWKNLTPSLDKGLQQNKKIHKYDNT